ncbi:hypothetical protein [Prosthecochloris sp.]
MHCGSPSAIRQHRKNLHKKGFIDRKQG